MQRCSDQLSCGSLLLSGASLFSQKQWSHNKPPPPLCLPTLLHFYIYHSASAPGTRVGVCVCVCLERAPSRPGCVFMCALHIMFLVQSVPSVCINEWLCEAAQMSVLNKIFRWQKSLLISFCSMQPWCWEFSHYVLGAVFLKWNCVMGPIQYSVADYPALRLIIF